MKVYISADIEGVAGVVAVDQTRTGNGEHERCRRLMTEEVNAAIEGALAGGATEVLVNDSHGSMTNLLPDLLHPKARLLQGRPKPFNMFAGLDDDHRVVFCTGYHAGVGQFGVLAHTTSSAAFRRIEINGMAMSEATLYGAYAGERGVPIGLISGDDQCADQHRTLFPQAELVTVKRSLGNRAADSLSPAAARQKLAAAAERVMRRLDDLTPFVIAKPRRLVIEMNTVVQADLAATIPVAERLDATRLRFQIKSAGEAVRWVNTLSALAASLG
ncbi:M55 family metallopeptidase [Telmatospirillum sp.]|uniref:M55 family metallopeptidase n=1 Tax=Telmatospirillum sp. TaxID=2079197 RepID=UPI0028485C08|nr:M55 family metallopeptidase [Telmatospirillum sp.]MDR3436361.1 M55 family metallopeptidase [Telmatospirillum sp.]